LFFRSRKLAAIAVLVVVPLGGIAVPSLAESRAVRWSGAWTAAMMRPSAAPWFGTWAEEGFRDQSLRQVIRLNTGGTELRVRLSNAQGGTPLRVTGATVGRAVSGAAVRPGTVHSLRFGDTDSVTLPPHGAATSDPVPMRTSPREQLTITLYFKSATGPATYHQLSMATSYRATGDHRRATGAAAFTDSIKPGYGSWYYLEGVEVAGGRPKPNAVVAFGDSITDGFGATIDGDDRYPDALAEHLIAAGRDRPVLNAGIGSNKLLTDSACGGDKGISRFTRDVLGQPRVGMVIVLIGINDIQFTDDSLCGMARADLPVTAGRLIDGYRNLIQAAHARGVKVIGATLLPYKGSANWTENGEQIRLQVNRWIRASGEYDAVADFDHAIDPHGTGRIPRSYDSGDSIHPSPLGYKTMADAIDLAAVK
jgi:lysophospholipase L1-like esterase